MKRNSKLKKNAAKVELIKRGKLTQGQEMKCAACGHQMHNHCGVAYACLVSMNILGNMQRCSCSGFVESEASRIEKRK